MTWQARFISPGEGKVTDFTALPEKSGISRSRNAAASRQATAAVICELRQARRRKVERAPPFLSKTGDNDCARIE